MTNLRIVARKVAHFPTRATLRKTLTGVVSFFSPNKKEVSRSLVATVTAQN
jgi:hypothetical protein